MVFFITTVLMIGYGLNLVILLTASVLGQDTKKRGSALLSAVITIAAACGVLYLAAH
jgi:hypothetical protein